MKRVASIIISTLIFGVMFTSCNADMENVIEREEENSVIENEEEKKTSVNSNKLHLFWNHVFQSHFGSGRGYIFSFSTIERFENSYELVFEYQINNDHKTIEISLIDKINNGKCPDIPAAWGGSDGFCSATGIVFIPESSLENEKYELVVKTASFTVQSEFIITEEVATLNIPDNSYLSSEWQGNVINITPKDLIYGSVSISGNENIRLAFDLFEDGEKSGVLKNTDLTIQSLSSWLNEDRSHKVCVMGGGYYNISFLYSIKNFSDVVELAKKHLNNSSAINKIWFYSTNGDEATLSK
jgi:hypothetical protein